MKRLIIASLGLVLLTACNAWERDTFNTLAASQAVINQAQAAYEVSATAPCPAQGAVACLPHSVAVYDTINKAKADQTFAVNSMVTYEEMKAASAGQSGLTAAESDVNVAVANLGTIVANVKALYGGGK